MKTKTQQAQKRFKKSKHLYCFKQARKTNKYDNNNKKNVTVITTAGSLQRDARLIHSLVEQYTAGY